MKIHIDKEKYVYQIGGSGNYYMWYDMAADIVKKYHKYLGDQCQMEEFDFYLIFKDDGVPEMTHIYYDAYGMNNREGKERINFDSDCFDGCLNIEFISIYAEYEIQELLIKDNRENIEVVE